MKWTRAVLVIAAFLFVINIWGYDLWAPDEPFYGEGAREMIADGQWLVSHVNGEFDDDKPPAYFWLIALLSLPFAEVSSFTARLPSVLAAFGTVALTLWFGLRWSSERTAVLAAFILTTSYMFWDKARSVQPDMVLCFLIWVALAAFETWRAGDVDGRRAGMVFWFALGLSVLVKWPVGLAIAGAIVFFTLLWDRELKRGWEFAPVLGAVVVIAMFCAWTYSTSIWGPSGYSAWGAFYRHFISRAVSGIHHAQPWWYYAKVLPAQLLPWTFVVPGAAVLALRRRDKNDRFLLVAIAFVLVLFSLSTEKRTLYVLPIFPAFALMTARFLGAAFGWDEAPAFSRRWVTIGQGILGVLLVLLGLAAPFATGRAGTESFSGWMFWVLGLLVLAGGVAALVGTFRKDLRTAVLAPAICFALVYVFIASIVYPAANDFKSAKKMALVIKEETAQSRSAGHEVLAVNIGNLYEAYNFFSKGVYFDRTEDVGDVARHFEQKPRVFAVVDARLLQELPPHIQERMETIATTHASRLDVALISNRPANPGEE